jgi:Zn-dependent peptidase ImmA (M78 family)
MNIRFARAEAENLIEKFEITKDDLPINIKMIAKRLGLNVVEKILDSDVSGLLVSHKRIDGASFIFVNEKDSPVRRRFTISHEIGHFVLRHKFDNENVHIDRGFHAIPRLSSAVSGVDEREVEANQFAASLLMPANFVNEIIQEVGLPLTENKISDIAKLFKVSEQAMTIRLTTLNLL